MKSGWHSRDFINTVRYAFSCLFDGDWYEKAYSMLRLMVIRLGIPIWDSVAQADILRFKRLQAA